MLTTKSRVPSIGLLGVAVLALVVLWSQFSTGSESDFWQDFVPIGAQEVEMYEGFNDMAASADLVVEGNIQTVKLGRSLFDESGDALIFAELKVKVSGSDDIMLEMPLMNIEDGTNPQKYVAELRKALPKKEHVFFLREKADRSGFYRPVNLAGVWRDGEGGLVAPMAEEEDVDRIKRNTSDVTSVKDLRKHSRTKKEK